MAKSDPHHLMEGPGTAGRTNDRRRFLARLGLLAGAGALAPILGASLPRRAHRVEASRPAV